MLTQQQLKALLWYEPRSGMFRWRHTTNRRLKPWDVAGSRGGVKRNYIYIQIGDSNYRAHRLAWLYMTGEWPLHLVDHIDGDGLNNAWENLREATNKQNSENKSVRSNVVSGMRGVHLIPAKNKWKATVTHEGKQHYLGLFDNAEEAFVVVEAKRKELYTHHTARTN